MRKKTGLTNAEMKLAEIIWQFSPIPSIKLIKIVEEKFGWKRTTTYTILKRIIIKGVVENENAVVRAIQNRDEFFAIQSHNFVKDAFDGSLPMFVASFIGGNKISAELAEELKQLIDDHTEES